MVIIPIKSESDVFKARRYGREMAQELGMLSRDFTMVEIVISELALNIVHHAGQGMIRINPLGDSLEIVSEDQGHGIDNLEEALVAGNRKPHGLGIGLAGVKRLMDQFEVESAKGKGCRITVKKWLHRPAHLIKPEQGNEIPRDGLLEYGAVTVPYFGGEFNGDAWVIKEFGRKVLLAVIDGLGHGEAAYTVTRQAVNFIELNYQRPLLEIISNSHKILSRTRGVVLGLVLLDLDKSKFFCAGVGNIAIEVVGIAPFKFFSKAGIVGHTCKDPRVMEFPHHRDDIIFLYSDGLSSGFAPKNISLGQQSLQHTAEQIIREYGQDHDDSTIVMAKER